MSDNTLTPAVQQNTAPLVSGAPVIEGTGPGLLPSPNIEDEKSQLEQRKYNLEVSKLRWSIVTGLGLPLVAGMLGIAHFVFDRSDEIDKRQIEFVRTLSSSKNCDQRKQFIADHRKVFPLDSDVNLFKDGGCVGPAKSLPDGSLNLPPSRE